MIPPRASQFATPFSDSLPTRTLLRDNYLFSKLQGHILREF
jgi:hypothetical protein